LKRARFENRQLLKTETYKILLKADLKQRLLTVRLKNLHKENNFAIFTHQKIVGDIYREFYFAKSNWCRPLRRHKLRRRLSLKCD
jgi:hypothetical protein